MTSLYHSQLHHIFNRPTTKPEWYWSNHWEEGIFDDEENPLWAFTLIEKLIQNPKADLSPYSDDQIGLGLEYIFNNSISNLANDFKIAAVPFERKEKAVRDLFVLFRDIFNPRCETKTGAYSQEISKPLNNICYMFWDSCALSTWVAFPNSEGIAMSFLSGLSEAELANMQLPKEVLTSLQQQMAGHKEAVKSPEDMVTEVKQQYKNMEVETRGFYLAIADVMKNCLSLSNPACVESGLHGLGHLAFFLPDIAVPIIDGYLKDNKNQDSALVQYAKSARTGMIL